MGETRDEGDETPEELRAQWQAMVDTGELFPGTALADLSASLREAGPWPEDLRTRR